MSANPEVLLPKPAPNSAYDRRRSETAAGRLKNRSDRLRVRTKQAIFEEYGIANFDPVVELAKIGADVEQPVDVRIVALKSVAPYLHSTLRPVDPAEGRNDDPGNVTDAKAMLARLMGMDADTVDEIQASEASRSIERLEDDVEDEE